MRTPCWLPCLAAVITSHAMQRGATSSIGMELTLGEIQAKILPSLSVLLPAVISPYEFEEGYMWEYKVFKRQLSGGQTFSF